LKNRHACVPGRAGFFVPFRYIEPFRSSLVFAIYGSTLPLSEKEFDNLKTCSSGCKVSSEAMWRS